MLCYCENAPVNIVGRVSFGINMCTSPVAKALPGTILLGPQDDPLVLEFQAMNPLSFLFSLSFFFSVSSLLHPCLGCCVYAVVRVLL